MIIRGHNVEVTEALNQFVLKKMNRLEKYFDFPYDSAVTVLSVVKEEQKVEVTLHYPGFIIRAEESGLDMYASIDLVIEKLERQIRKYKTKTNRKIRQDQSLKVFHKNVPDDHNVATIEVDLDTELYLEDDHEVVRTKRFNLKPMYTEEAILQMDMLGHNFFVFNSSDANQIKVIYKRKDGKIGLIEPE